VVPNPRKLLTFAPSDSREYEEQRDLFLGHEPGFEDRDLTITIFPEDDDTEMRDRYGVKPGSFVVVLVGRDGGEKFRSEEPISAKELFDRIDAMPMRRREMRES
jgi:hypothetical protein